MGRLLAYSGLVTKVRGMQAKLLTDEDFKKIAGMHTVLEIVAFLREKPAYKEHLGRLEDAKLHRGDIEKVLDQSLYSDYVRLYRFAGMEQKRFLELYLKRYEMNLINYCLRIVFNHYETPFDLNYKKAFFDEYSSLSIDKLITSKDVHGLVENLKGTEYYAPLKRLDDAGCATLFDYDLALNMYYFTMMWKKRKKILRSRELEVYTKDCGTKIDLLNLQWIYRAKRYYRMLPPDIYPLLIPIHYRIGLDLLKELVEAPSVDEFYKVVAKTPYAKRMDMTGRYTIEKMYKQCLGELYMADRRCNPYSIAAVNLYLFQKEEEIDHLTTAMECIRYGLSEKETLDYIGGVAR